MVQAINTKAIFTLASVLRRPSLMVPHVSVSNVSELDFQAMKDHAGIRAVIFDKDNTLTIPYETKMVHPTAQAGLESAMRVFSSEGVAILSNSAGTRSEDPEYASAKAIEDSLGIAVIRHVEKKPGGLSEVVQHFESRLPNQQPPVLSTRPTNDDTERDKDDSPGDSMLMAASVAPHLCVIGDRILTDVVFGNLYGMLTVHTQPLTSQTSTDDDDDDKSNDEALDELSNRDHWTARLVRPMENLVIYRKRSRDGEGQPHQRRFWSSKCSKHVYWSGPSKHPLTLTKKPFNE